MLIPSIDLMDGKIVQLVQGERKALESEDFDYWVERFSKYPLVQLIDLDAAMQKGHNRALVAKLASRLPCQVGGGIRSIEAAQSVLKDGAAKVILSSALLHQGRTNIRFAEQLAGDLGAERLVFAADSRGGRVAIQGWRELTNLSPQKFIEELNPFCGGFLYTNIDTEGLMLGIPFDIIGTLRSLTSRWLGVAGGISKKEEIDQLDVMNVDAIVGMAIYTGRLDS